MSPIAAEAENNNAAHEVNPYFMHMESTKIKGLRMPSKTLSTKTLVLFLLKALTVIGRIHVMRSTNQRWPQAPQCAKLLLQHQKMVDPSFRDAVKDNESGQWKYHSATNISTIGTIYGSILLQMMRTDCVSKICTSAEMGLKPMKKKSLAITTSMENSSS